MEDDETSQELTRIQDELAGLSTDIARISVNSARSVQQTMEQVTIIKQKIAHREGFSTKLFLERVFEYLDAIIEAGLSLIFISISLCIMAVGHWCLNRFGYADHHWMTKTLIFIEQLSVTAWPVYSFFILMFTFTEKIIIKVCVFFANVRIRYQSIKGGPPGENVSE